MNLWVNYLVKCDTIRAGLFTGKGGLDDPSWADEGTSEGELTAGDGAPSSGAALATPAVGPGLTKDSASDDRLVVDDRRCWMESVWGAGGSMAEGVSRPSKGGTVGELGSSGGWRVDRGRLGDGGRLLLRHGVRFAWATSRLKKKKKNKRG